MDELNASAQADVRSRANFGGNQQGHGFASSYALPELPDEIPRHRAATHCGGQRLP